MRSIDKGQLAVLKTELRAAEKGITPCRPTLEGTRYDLILDDKGSFKRVQIKYCDCKTTACKNSYSVNLRKKQSNSKKTVKLYDGDELDGLIVYLPSVDKLLWFEPNEFAGKQMITIRTAAAKNGQTKGCLMADDHIW